MFNTETCEGVNNTGLEMFVLVPVILVLVKFMFVRLTAPVLSKVKLLVNMSVTFAVKGDGGLSIVRSLAADTVKTVRIPIKNKIKSVFFILAPHRYLCYC